MEQEMADFSVSRGIKGGIDRMAPKCKHQPKIEKKR